MKKLIFTIILILSINFSVFGQDIIKSLTTKEWNGKGTLMGSDANFQMNWKWTLNNQFIHLTFKNERKNNNGQYVTFNAHGYYKINNDNTIEGIWFDSRGIYFSLKGTLEADKLTIIWGNPETEEGKTIYTLNEKDQIKTSDFILKNGKYINFGNAIYN